MTTGVQKVIFDMYAFFIVINIGVMSRESQTFAQPNSILGDV